jgi:hypothetical protein
LMVGLARRRRKTIPFRHDFAPRFVFRVHKAMIAQKGRPRSERLDDPLPSPPSSQVLQ